MLFFVGVFCCFFVLRMNSKVELKLYTDISDQIYSRIIHMVECSAKSFLHTEFSRLKCFCKKLIFPSLFYRTSYNLF